MHLANLQNTAILDRAEWDYSKKLSGPCLTACWLYEYARESPKMAAAAADIKELRKNEWCEFSKLPPAPRLLWKGKRLTFLELLKRTKRSEIRDFASNCSEAEWQAYKRFLKRSDEYDALQSRLESLPYFYDAFLDVIRRHGLRFDRYQANFEFILKQPFFPEIPWLRLNPQQQETLIKYPVICQPVAPGTLNDLNAIRDALPDVIKAQTPKAGTVAAMLWPNFSCCPFTIKNGMEIRPFKIDWAGSADSEICKTFETWVKDQRKQIGIKPPHFRQTRRNVVPPGRGGDEDLRNRLRNLGIMRILHTCRIDQVFRIYPEAWRQWIFKETAGTKLEANSDIYLKHPNAFLLNVSNETSKCTMTYRRILLERRRGAVALELRSLFPFEKTHPVNWVLAR